MRTHPPPDAGLLDGAVMSDVMCNEVVGAVFDRLVQPVFLYRPVIEDQGVVDLEIVYCNRSALDMPLSDGVVPGVMVTDVFVAVNTALDAASTVLAGERADPYSLVRTEVVDGRKHSIRYEVTTGLVGEFIVQTIEELTVADQLAQSESRLHTIASSLDEGVVLLEPCFDSGLRLIDVSVICTNERARHLDDLISPRPASGESSPWSLRAPPLDVVRTAWTSGGPVTRSIDNADGSDPDLPAIAIDLRLTRVGDLLVHVGLDHTTDRLATQSIDRAQRRFDVTVEAIDEALGVFDPVFDDSGEICDFVLVHANAAMRQFVLLGEYVSALDTSIDDLVHHAVEVFSNSVRTAREIITVLPRWTGSRSTPSTPPVPITMNLGVIALDGQLVVVGTDVTEMQGALARVTASDARLRTVLESVAESVRLFDAAGRNTYANAASLELLGPVPSHGGARPYEVCHPDGSPLDGDQWPLQRGLRGERVTDLVLGVRHDSDEIRVCRVDVRPIFDGVSEKPTSVVVSAHDITETSRSADRLAWISSHSMLTSMPNRLGFLDEIERRGITRDGRYVVVWVRLSALETIRPTFGHDVGDDVVCVAGRRVEQVARAHDGVAAHCSDHEFAIAVRGDERIADRLAHALHRELSDPVDTGTVALLLEPAVGLCTTIEGDHDSVVAVLQHAQVAAWSAERKGAPAERWRADVDAGQMRRVELLGDVRRAIADDEMELHYQPKFDVESGRLVGAEALARWTRQGEGPIRPDEFIPAVEASGVAGPFTMWAIRRALQEWSTVAASHPGTTVAVNVPGPLIVDPSFARAVQRELARSATSDVRLTLEITERSVAADVDAIGEAIERFAALGVDISIDDFGTGQSSLAYLRHLRPAEIKVDRTFVAGAADGSDPVGLSVLQACIDIGRAAGVTVCGEGVETDAELELLRQLGCTTAQGYLLGHPVPISMLLGTNAAA